MRRQYTTIIHRNYVTDKITSDLPSDLPSNNLSIEPSDQPSTEGYVPITGTSTSV